MNHQLNNSQPDYIRMVVTGVVEKANFIKAISELINHPDYHCKHVLWDFSSADMGLSMGDLLEIAGVLRLFKAKDKNFANKSALLIPDHMHRAMANIFVSISKLLPFEYKVFKTNNAAMHFLTPSESNL